ncbi:L-alanine-DL-glutamate epimerase-like enolase superfamily enzyme [Pseudorhizobium tarimense]|uniref:L-alanine-DL-glutamate epimerase-like enolase superfamily enzyme n=1 Tax=Pseudorhizobium tarimense TaxID=1079109 RepID=A0ABV2H6F8_9HYPH|nr:mandelate racemase/muconate lactonizing enzyme family protein [Pseudorhizobium tarimense]MCJ8519090.1 mandelate racemase/muconate lactonizing enzyme family protein [Pseudorhizobium tarimense]
MKIKAIEMYGYKLSYAHGEYVMSGGRAATHQDSTLVRIITDSGLEGWGETATLSGTYLPTFCGSTRASIEELAPALIGEDPRNINHINRLMNGRLLGQYNAKSAIDTACWDIFGRSVGLPISTLLGGVQQEQFPLYEAVPLASPDAMAEYVTSRGAAGVRRFQLKVGNDPHEDAERVREVMNAAEEDMIVIADSNGGWSLQSGIIAVRLMDDLDIYVEQPCRETADCAIVKSMTHLPLVMDESVVTSADLYRAKYEAKAGSINIKLGRVGGITGAVRMRDQAQDLGIDFCIEDMWGGDVISAAVAHVAASSSPESLMHASFFNDWTNEHVAGYQPRSLNGMGSAPTGPGLGIEVDLSVLGEPLASFR